VSFAAQLALALKAALEMNRTPPVTVGCDLLEVPLDGQYVEAVPGACPLADVPPLAPRATLVEEGAEEP
jgi:hypothetical protein